LFGGLTVLPLTGLDWDLLSNIPANTKMGRA